MVRKMLRNTALKIKNEDFSFQYKIIKQIMNEEDLAQFQKKELYKLLTHVSKNVQYYKNLLTKSYTDESSFIKKFNSIPILKKRDLKKQFQKLISKDYLSRRWYTNYSGGSTGEPTKFIQDKNYNKWVNATNRFYYNEILNIDEENVKKVILWGSQKDTFENKFSIKKNLGVWLNNIKFLNSFKMTPQDMNRYVKIINTFKPDLIRGYANSLYEFSLFIEKTKKKIYSPRVIISSAETLDTLKKKKIETIFNTKVYNFYGSRETAAIGGECEEGLIHIFSFNNLLEVLDNNDDKVKQGNEGRIIITNLHNYSMPFIRYEIGDTAILGPKRCKCGIILPTLKKLTGRIDDRFIRRDGTVVSGYFFIHLFSVIYYDEKIQKFQIIQEDYEKIRILIESDAPIPQAKKSAIEDKINEEMGGGIHFIWEYVDEIKKAKSGKYIFTKSLLNP